jgi:Rrf2 family nitric oxide-sensitive transcriptional repressor
MRLTTFTDYSLRLLIYLGTKPESRATIADVAAAYGISGNHLVKVAHRLGRAGLLENARGHGGGMRLARPAKEINIADVVRLTEGGDVPAECFDRARNECAITRGCRLRGALAEAVDAFYAVLSRYTLEDLVRHRAPIARVLLHARAAG